jgi:parvulin-like peptidyl-prolyl isomerase
MNYKVVETPPIKEDAMYIPAIGSNKNLIEWAFKENLNNISEVYKVPTGYIVAKISQITQAGVKKFEEVEKNIKPLATREKKFEKAKEIADKIYTQVKSNKLTLNNVKSVFSNAQYDSTGSFTVNQSIPNVGRDYVFNDKALNSQLNKVSEPFRGQRGYYILKVTKRNPFDETSFKIQRTSIRENLMQEKKSYFFNQWLAQLKKNANIVDDRRFFYR